MSMSEDFVFAGYEIECLDENGKYITGFSFDNSRDGAADCMTTYESLLYPPTYAHIVVYHGNDCIING